MIFFLELLFQRLQNTCLFYYLSLLQEFCHLPAETKILNYFLSGYRSKKILNNTGKEPISTEFHWKPTSEMMHLHCQWHLVSVSQTIIQVCYVNCMIFFSGKLDIIKSKRKKDYVTLTLTLLSIGIKLSLIKQFYFDKIYFSKVF